MLKKIIAGCAVVAAAFLYIVFSNRQSPSNSARVPMLSDTTATASSAASGASAGGANPPDTGVSIAASLKDGTYDGPVADAVYGPLKVEAIIQGGKLADVKFLQYPDAPGHTTDVSAMSLPRLKTEAIAAQSAQVDIVSGATQTSEAFQQSLGAALQSAQA